MGVVTALGAGSLVAGIAAGPIVDRVDRRKLMIRCRYRPRRALRPDARGVVAAGTASLADLPEAVGSALAMLFGVAYITAVVNLVDRDQIVDANGRLQTSTPWRSSSGRFWPG